MFNEKGRSPVLVVEAASNNVDNIHWSFSYPTAFSNTQQNIFVKSCKNAIESVYNNTGYIYDENMIDDWSESEASACYFGSLGGNIANLNEGALCIDIGAGTTDISVISGAPGRIVYHMSIQYAGRYMFKPIYDNYELFVSDKIANNLKTIKLADKEQRQAVIDAAMREHSEEYIKDLLLKTDKIDIKRKLYQHT